MEKRRTEAANGQRRSQETSWETRWAARKAKGDADAAASSQPPARLGARSAAFARVEKIEVIAHHALLGTEARVVLPRNAKFKHVKRALAKSLGTDDFVARGQVIQKVEGVYKPYKDEALIGEVRRVLVMCPGLRTFGVGDSAASLSDGDLSEQEAPIERGTPGDAADPAECEGPPDSAAGAAEGSRMGGRPRRARQEAKTQGLPSAKARPRGAGLNKQQALALQQDLLGGFKAPDFQAKLGSFVDRRPDYATHAEFLQARQDLFLEVQSRVLPEHGFEGSRIGVVQMMAAMGPLAHDKELMRIGDEIHKLLGVDLPPDNFRAVSKQCGDLKTEDIGKAKEARRVDAQTSDQQASAQPRVGDTAVVNTVVERRRPGVTSLPALVPIPRSWVDEGKSQACGAVSSQDVRPFLEALPFARWSSPIPPGALSIVGTWNGHQPQPMQWAAGLFMFPVTIGPSGHENFHLVLNGMQDGSIYPSSADANHYDDYAICGPDKRATGTSWQIGKGYPDAEDSARPDARFAIVAVFDARAAIKLVGWQPF